jgi:hypothetical protein
MTEVVGQPLLKEHLPREGDQVAEFRFAAGVAVPSSLTSQMRPRYRLVIIEL